MVTTGLVAAMKKLGITDKQVHTMLVEKPPARARLLIDARLPG